VSWLTDQLAGHGVRTFADLRLPGVSADAPVEERYRLVVVAADISRHELVQLPWDYSRYGLDPDQQSVVSAVRASMSIPFFFQPAVLHHQPTGSSTLVDGGLLWNFPIDIFNRTGVPEAVPTIGIKLSAKVVAEQVSRPAGFGPFGIAVDSIATLLAEHDRYHLDDEGVTAHTIFVDTFGVSAVDFAIDRPTQDRLYNSGREAAQGFLTKLNPRT
jgi:NTE family protein